jgi:hypothetical protein
MQKVIDVTFATMRNVGTHRVSPEGFLRCAIVRAADDKQIFQEEFLYDRDGGQPMHPSGATGIPPGQSLLYNVTKRLTVHHYDEESEGHLNQMLIFGYDLTQRVATATGQVEVLPYFGQLNFQVQYEEIDGFNTFSLPYNTAAAEEDRAKIVVAYTVSLISG